MEVDSELTGSVKMSEKNAFDASIIYCSVFSSTRRRRLVTLERAHAHAYANESMLYFSDMQTLYAPARPPAPPLVLPQYPGVTLNAH